MGSGTYTKIAIENPPLCRKLLRRLLRHLLCRPLAPPLVVAPLGVLASISNAPLVVAPLSAPLAPPQAWIQFRVVERSGDLEACNAAGASGTYLGDCVFSGPAPRCQGRHRLVQHWPGSGCGVASIRPPPSWSLRHVCDPTASTPLASMAGPAAYCTRCSLEASHKAWRSWPHRVCVRTWGAQSSRSLGRAHRSPARCCGGSSCRIAQCGCGLAGSPRAFPGGQGCGAPL